MELKVIAYARNGHTNKFGIPRQSREESPIVTRIVFEPEYSVPEALRGIEGFSHLWLIWGFSEITTEAINEWSPTVRPPRLGGNKRMGVFATRSPFRPNPVGLSSVKLLKVESRKSKDASCSLELLVSGADLLDGTPIYDIKPYLSFTDCHEEARNGFAEETKEYRLAVNWDNVMVTSYEQPTNDPLITHSSPTVTSMEEDVKKDIEYILSQDPRPGYQDDPEREYKLDYGGWTVTFQVKKDVVYVKNIKKM